MGKNEKPAIELTRDELAKRVFPKKLLEEAKKLLGKRSGNSS